jgi:hypothetical protein
VTLRDLLPSMSPRDQALSTLILSSCFMHPIPLPGVSNLCGLVIAWVGSRMALRLAPWVPARWQDRPIPGPSLERVFLAGARIMRMLEKVARPRGRAVSAHPWTLVLSGSAIAVCGLCIAAPLPPGTNVPPAAAAVLLSIGILEHDLLFLAAGGAAFGLNLVFFAAVIKLGVGGVAALF